MRRERKLAARALIPAALAAIRRGGGPLLLLPFSPLLLLALFALWSLPSWAEDPSQGRPPDGGAITTVYMFGTEGCPYCARARAFLEAQAAREPGIKLNALELSRDRRADQAFEALMKRFTIETPVVPLIVVGDKAFIGFESDLTTGGQIGAAIAACLKRPCPDITGPLLRDPEAETGAPETDTNATAQRLKLPATIRAPLIGEVETRSLSLPALTVVLGALDGFNPCAMWVLVFLIGLLVAMRDPLRMWAYGALFLLTSAAVYFAFMAAWLNVFLFLGSLGWVRAGIGLFAIGAGGYHLREFVKNSSAVCAVASPGERQKIMDRLRSAVGQSSFILGAAGVVVLAVAVNLIELLCSAGIPAVYTQVLAMSQLSPAAYYGYLLLYISVFLMDDIIVFVVAMVTLRAVGLTAAYARYASLIGGVVLVGVGVLLMLRPEWLNFV